MTPRRVRFTAAAQQQLENERNWWIKNRDQREFATELERSLVMLAAHPRVGRKQRSNRFKGLRRALLRKSRCFIFYTVHADTVVIRALWGARRARRPRL